MRPTPVDRAAAARPAHPRAAERLRRSSRSDVARRVRALRRRRYTRGMRRRSPLRVASSPRSLALLACAAALAQPRAVQRSAAGDRARRPAARSARDARADSRRRTVPLRARRRPLRQPRAAASAEGRGTIITSTRCARRARATAARGASSAAAPPRTPDACYYTDDHYRSFARIRE